MMKSFMTLGLAIIVVLITTIIDGFVLAQLWNWFIPVNFSITPISIPLAIAVILIFSFLNFQRVPKAEDQATSAHLLLFKCLRGGFFPSFWILVNILYLNEKSRYSIYSQYNTCHTRLK